MTDKEKLIAHVLDLKERCATDSVITSTNFLSSDELSDVIKTERVNNQYVDTFYYGGYEGAERKTAVFIPKFYSVAEDEAESFLNDNGFNPLKILSVRKDKFSVLSHRDYLGALMGLGLKREMIGDIVSDENGCTIFCMKSIADFVAGNLKQAGRGQLTVCVGDTDEFLAVEGKTETFFASVASLRLDCLVAAAFRLSRTNAVNGINQGLVYLNGSQVMKTDHMLKQGDKLVFRGKGKTVIEEIIGENKKGRIHLNVKRYL